MQDVNAISGNGNGDLSLRLYKANSDLSNWSELTLFQYEINFNVYSINLPKPCK